MSNYLLIIIIFFIIVLFLNKKLYTKSRKKKYNSDDFKKSNINHVKDKIYINNIDFNKYNLVNKTELLNFVNTLYSENTDKLDDTIIEMSSKTGIHFNNK